MKAVLLRGVPNSIRHFLEMRKQEESRLWAGLTGVQARRDPATWTGSLDKYATLRLLGMNHHGQVALSVTTQSP